MDKTKENRSCRTCGYFSQHYIKYGSKFIPIESGCCMCGSIDGKRRKEFRYRDGCDYWKEKKNSD